MSTLILRMMAKYADIGTLKRRVTEQKLIVAINGGLLDKYRRELALLEEKEEKEKEVRTAANQTGPQTPQAKECDAILP